VQLVLLGIRERKAFLEQPGQLDRKARKVLKEQIRQFRGHQAHLGLKARQAIPGQRVRREIRDQLVRREIRGRLVCREIAVRKEQLARPARLGRKAIPVHKGRLEAQALIRL